MITRIAIAIIFCLSIPAYAMMPMLSGGNDVSYDLVQERDGSVTYYKFGEQGTPDRYCIYSDDTFAQSNTTITGISVELRADNNSPTQIITVHLCDESGDEPTNCATASQTIDSSALGVNPEWSSILPISKTLTNGQTFIVELESDSIDGSDYPYWEAGTASGDQIRSYPSAGCTGTDTQRVNGQGGNYRLYD